MSGRRVVRPGRRHPLAVVVSCALLSGVLVGVGLAAWTIFGGVPYLWNRDQDFTPVVRAIDHFMLAGERNDPDAAVAFVAKLGRTPTITVPALTTLFATRRDLFAGYESITHEIASMGMGTTWGGTRATVSGKVTYADRRPSVPYEFRLVKHNNRWQLVEIRFGDIPGQPQLP